jgi:hypothetical protein
MKSNVLTKLRRQHKESKALNQSEDGKRSLKNDLALWTFYAGRLAEGLHWKTENCKN